MSKEDLIKLRENQVPRGVGQALPAVIAEAKGAMVRDVEGREFVDFSGGIGVLNVGHCPEEVVEAIRDQAGKYLHTCFQVQMYEPYIALAKELNELVSRKTASIRPSILSASARRVNFVASRFFFMMTGVRKASRAPRSRAISRK